MRQPLLWVFLFGVIALFAQDKKQPEKQNKPKEQKDFVALAKAKGGDEKTEKAVEMALEWLARHQCVDTKEKSLLGSWELKCRECVGQRPAVKGFRVALTALAMLAFVRHGNTHKEGKYKNVVKRAAEFLLRNQTEEGWLGAEMEVDWWIYNHAIATMALCELLAESKDFKWKELVDGCARAVKCILKAQNPGLGWRYRIRSGDNDSSITGWMVKALKAAERVGVLDISKKEWAKAYIGALNWFARCTNPQTGWVGYMSKFDSGSVIPGVNDKYERLPAMTAVATLSRLLCGFKPDNPVVKKSVRVLMRHLPVWDLKVDPKAIKVDMYYWYFATYALFLHGGDVWKRWNDALKRMLLTNQCKEGCRKGSWDPVGKWGMVGGRVYSTALCTLMLEVYYWNPQK